MVEPTLDDALAAREAALRRVEAAADADWMRDARAAVEAAARDLGAFTADDLWSRGLQKPREPRALGPVMRAAAADGVIEHSGVYHRSRFRHATPIPVWRAA